MASDLNYKKTTKPKYSKLGFFMAIIPLTGFAIFGLLPLLLSVVVSFFKPVGYRFPGMSFVGWDNYARVLRDPLFLKSIGNTLYAMLSIPVTLVLSLLIATILSNPKIKGKAIFRTIFFIPHVSSIVAVSLMWKWILDGEYGIVNHLLSFLGVKGPDWLGDSRTFMPAMIVMGVWGSLGFYVILFSAALTNVDPQLYEAAEIDGAGPFTKFVKITMPAISPVTFYLLVMSVIWGLQDFARFQIMAPGGGPDNAGLTMVYYLYNAGFTNIITYGMGIAAAVSWILTFVIAGVTALNFLGFEKVGGKIMTADKKQFKSKTYYKWKERIKLIASYAFLIAVALFILIPFYVIFITSFKTRVEAISIPFTWLPREGWHLDGYANVLLTDASGGGAGPSTILRGFRNTMIITIPATLSGLLTSALSAYAFAKLRFRGKKVSFALLLATMMIPGIIMLVPSYMIYDALGLVDTFFPLIVPGMFGAAAAVFFLRQYFQGIPDELIEAARIDGMSEFGIFFKIMMPLSKPALLAQGILGFIGGYNDYFGPLLYLHNPKRYTLQIALAYFEGTYVFDWPTVMAGAVITLVPTIVIFLAAQKYFVEGITMTGIK